MQQCQALVDAGIQNVYMPNNALYSERVGSYWSLTSQVTPECFVQPQNTEEVAAVVKVLLQETQCPFAVRSGGHSSTAGANNIEKAVTIDLGKAEAYLSVQYHTYPRLRSAQQNDLQSRRQHRFGRTRCSMDRRLPDAR